MFLRQSTASQEVLMGPFLDDTDGKTAETALTITNTDIKVWKSGATTEANKNSGGATHIAAGRYYAVFDATDTDTVGMLEINIAVSGALPVQKRLYVLEEAVFDNLFAADAAGPLTSLGTNAPADWINAAAFANDVTLATTQDVEDATEEIIDRGDAAWVTGGGGGGGGGTCASLAVRTIDDETPLRFTWPTPSETITVERSVNAGAFEAAAGAVTFFRTEGLQHFYKLAYDAADRAIGIVRYRLNDGTDTLFMTLQVLDLSSGGGGDATEDNQLAILAALTGTEVIQVASPNVDGNLVLTQGDTYDGIGNPKATWSVTTDYTDGWEVMLTIRDKNDEVVYSAVGSVDSATVITVEIEAPTGLPMEGCPGSFQGKFDVELRKDDSVKTIALGVCYINEDQTR